MRIALDATPLIGDNMSGVGYCEVGQLNALAKAHPEDIYTLQYFIGRDDATKKQRLAPYCRDNVKTFGAPASGYLYRVASTFLPISYSKYFGTSAQVTHFFNYIVYPKVAGKIVVTVHDMVYKRYPETVNNRTQIMLDLGLKKSLKRADVIVTDSEFSKSEIQTFFPDVAEKIQVVYCGVDATRFHPIEDPASVQAVREKYALDRPYFFYLGNVEPRKNLSRLIEGYAQFADKYDDAPYLVLAGGKGWKDAGIYERVSTLHLEDQVKFTGYMPEADLCPLQCGAIAFVFPSIYEGFGLPPLEAMACGVPVLTSTAASLPEVVGDDAILVDPYHPEAIADGLSRLYEDADLRAKLSAAGLARAKIFTWEKSAAKLHAIYEDLCV